MTLVVGSATLILASWAAVGAQILVREAVEDEGAAPGRAGRDPDGVDREYKSGALPKEAPRARSRLKRAEDHFRRQQWADGLAIVDEVLAETTSPGYRRRPRRDPPYQMYQQHHQNLAAEPATHCPSERHRPRPTGD